MLIHHCQPSVACQRVSVSFSKMSTFLKDKLEMNPLLEHPHFVFVRSSVLPSMVKTRLYTVRLCLNDKGDLLRLPSRIGR